MSERLFFMIEGGKALDLVKHHIAEIKRVGEQSRQLARELDVKEVSTSKSNGVVVAVHFAGERHPDFKKPDKWGSRPKKGTDWASRFATQKGYEDASTLIQRSLNVPCQISYSFPEKGSGMQHIGFPFQECGFLFLGEEGPYAMWIPDVAHDVREKEEKGWIVDEPAKSFKAEFEGCRRIELEEWQIIVAQHKLAKKQDQKEAA
ncbi:hypothetical protein AWB80_08165 [Caballeronia pedi]|uniref:Uncharacterized protein n=1 Tax=Caballeronia pedi TaxID=1777141 RepID=A0A158E3Y6_9BURK|nr:hypothetical protein [Caballeronia pedi]SAL01611.1 hypothetical protein AWB80_08165 [Caballeronia pedi]